MCRLLWCSTCLGQSFYLKKFSVVDVVRFSAAVGIVSRPPGLATCVIRAYCKLLGEFVAASGLVLMRTAAFPLFRLTVDDVCVSEMINKCSYVNFSIDKRFFVLQQRQRRIDELRDLNE